MTPAQETSTGKSLADQYGDFGVANCTDIASPATVFGLIIGERGTGKTSFFRDCPGALIYNFDLHSMPMHSADATPPKAQIYPAVNKFGQIVNMRGEVVVPDWQLFEDSKDSIVAAAKAGKPHPRMVVFDTLPAAIPLLKEFIATSGILNKTYSCFSDIPDGKLTQSAYGETYDYVPKFVNEFRSVGVGVWFIAHLMTRYIKIDPDKEGNPRTVQVVQHNITEKIHFRCAPRLEFMGAIGKTNMKVSEPGEPAKYENMNCLVRIVEGLDEGLCARVNIPDILPLPAVGAWDTFESAYLKAANSSSS